MKRRVLLLVGLGLVCSVHAEEDIWTRTINNDSNGTWKILPDKPKPKKAPAPEHLGGHATRVKATKSANAWDVQASSAIQGGIGQGDVIMIQLYARAEVPAEGGSKINARIQLAAEPYTTVLDTQAVLTGEWKAFCAHRVANASLPAKKGNVSIHLATADQTVDLGPVFVFNFGPGYDVKKLAGCNG